MSQPTDTNASIWQSSEIVEHWAQLACERERMHAAQWQFMAGLLPFAEQQPFTFLDLGAGTGRLSRAILDRYPNAVAILADFSAHMIGAGESEMQPFAGRCQYVEFDMSTGDWPAAIPETVDAVVTSLFVHHLPDERKQGLFTEIFARLVPGGWSLNYDPVRTEDRVARAVWERVNDRENPEAAHRRLHPTAQERAKHENHVRFIIPLDQQLGYLRSAGFEGVDAYWKRLDYVVYGGCRNS